MIYMLGFGSQEILLIFFVFILLGLPIIIGGAVIYFFVKVYTGSKLKSRDDHINDLEARIDRLENEKAIDQRLNSLEKRFEEQNKK